MGEKEKGGSNKAASSGVATNREEIAHVWGKHDVAYFAYNQHSRIDLDQRKKFSENRLNFSAGKSSGSVKSKTRINKRLVRGHHAR